jgi:rod shape-determining protein MreB
VAPLRDGVVDDMAAAHDFAGHLGRLLNAPASAEVRAVIGVPASADRSARESITTVFAKGFHKLLLIPEPFLAALGYRDETRLSDSTYLDPVRNSLFVDIGAGTTDVCLVQGRFPTADDQVSAAFAGDDVDNLLHESLRKLYPDVELSLVKVREIKEQHSYVGQSEVAASVGVVVGGKMRRLELGPAVGEACQQLLQNILDLVKTAISRASNDSVAELLQNIILTGGGSRIHNLDTELQRLLAEEGYEKPRVLTVGESYKEYVAKGALVAARQAKQSQWQTLGG